MIVPPPLFVGVCEKEHDFFSCSASGRVCVWFGWLPVVSFTHGVVNRAKLPFRWNCVLDRSPPTSHGRAGRPCWKASLSLLPLAKITHKQLRADVSLWTDFPISFTSAVV